MILRILDVAESGFLLMSGSTNNELWHTFGHERGK